MPDLPDDQNDKPVEIYGFEIPADVFRVYEANAINESAYEAKSLFELAQQLRLPIYRYWYKSAWSLVATWQYGPDNVQRTVKKLRTKPYVVRTHKLSITEISSWEEYFDQQNFWDLPTDIDRYGLDGASMSLEALVDGRYHIVNRWQPTEDDPFKVLSDFFYALSQNVTFE